MTGRLKSAKGLRHLFPGVRPIIAYNRKMIATTSKTAVGTIKLLSKARRSPIRHSRPVSMRMLPKLGKLAAFGAACYVVSQPLACYAASDDKISGSDDAPPVSEIQDGEDKQPPNFKYTHLW